MHLEGFLVRQPSTTYTTLGLTVVDLSISSMISRTSYLHAKQVKWCASPVEKTAHRMTNEVSCDATCIMAIGIEDAWENVQAYSGRQGYNSSMQFRKFSGETSTTYTTLGPTVVHLSNSSSMIACTSYLPAKQVKWPASPVEKTVAMYVLCIIVGGP
jgi:hypothetical protein